ncbi:MAG: ATP-binding protein [Planctomycetes bacterium]|nr:ATP-binding protein [Planctomycetota bacterium]
MYRRHVEPALRAALADTRIVLLNGARQTGKSTLAEELAKEQGGRYLTLDDGTLLGTARSDPTALLQGAAGLTVIDEVQKAPELLPALKREVDRDKRPGRFLLTGSANIFLVPRVAESLAGRIEILALLPLSQDELAGRAASLPDALFSGRPWRSRRSTLKRLEVGKRIVAGGYPEVLAREPGARRAAWFTSYVSSLLQRDVRDLANIDGLTEMPRLLGLLAARASTLMNMAELSRAVGIPHSTLKRYLTLLEATFILQPLPAWSANLGKRFVKASKIHLLDAGLTAHLRGESEPAQLVASPTVGPLLETFVLQELRKQLGWSRQAATPYHFRTAAGREVDIVLEAPGGKVVGIEVKAAAALDASDFAGLQALAEAAGKKFVRGVVLYLGEHVVPRGDNLWALPIDELWQPAAK